MEVDHYYDIVIIGGGPAGAAAAITLSRHTTLRVSIIERNDFNDHRAGESVFPAIFSLLEYLGISKETIENAHLLSYGHAAAWGGPELLSRDMIFKGQGNGMHMDREKFDTILLAEAGRQGTVIFQPAEIRQIEFDEHWKLSIYARETEIDISASYLIDCSGKQALIVKKTGCPVHKEDALIGLYAYYQLNDDMIMPHQTLIETTEYGWYYLSPLPNKKVVIAFITDADILKHLRLSEPGNWLNWGLKTQHIARIITQLPMPHAFRYYAIHSRVALLPDSEKWTAAGDAAACFDPISALGIDHAINSGIHAARVAEAALKGDQLAAKNYSRQVLTHFETYLNMRHGFYSAEKRWLGSSFWQRRTTHHTDKFE